MPVLRLLRALALSQGRLDKNKKNEQLIAARELNRSAPTSPYRRGHGFAVEFQASR